MSRLESELLKKIPGLSHGFLTANEPRPECISVTQVHGTCIQTVSSSLPQHPSTEKADGLFASSSSGKIRLGIQTADCLPVLVASTDGRFLMAVHAGWRGVEAGILTEAITRFVSAGVNVGNLCVAIGPAIGSCCFEVGREVYEKFPKEYVFSKQPQSSSPRQARPAAEGCWLDLKNTARAQLIGAGVSHEHLDILPVCTYCGNNSDAVFESYRRSTHQKRKAGRQWSFIGNYVSFENIK